MSATRPFLIIGNLKMNLISDKEGDHYLSELRKAAYGKHFSSVLGVIAPPFIHLTRFAHLPTHFSLGAQDMHWEKSGASTGSISPLMLKNVGATYVILGHSERRSQLGESDQIVRMKVDAALHHSLIPIVCIGEMSEEKESGDTTRVVGEQLASIFSELSSLQAEKIIVAYEPRWAIGTGTTPSSTEIFQVKVFIRKWFTEHFDARLAEKVRVIYGGSVTALTLPAVSWDAEMDGVLVGKESLFPREIVKMMEIADRHFKQEM